MRVLAASLLIVAAASAGDEWRYPRGNLANTGVVKNKGPRKTPKVKWSTEEKGAVTVGAAAAEGLLVYPLANGTVACRTQTTGREHWMFKAKQEVVSWPAILGKLAFFGGQDEVHYRVKMTNAGEPLTQVAKAAIVAAPAVTEDFYVAGATDGLFYVMGTQDGKLRWSRKIGAISQGAAIAKGKAYVVTDQGDLFAYDLKRGKQLWKFEAKEKPLAAPILSKTEVLLVLKDRVQAVSLKKGAAGASHATKGIAGAPVLAAKLLHYATSDGEVVTLDLKSGKEKRTKIADAAISTPLILARNVIYGAAGRTLFAFDPKSRKVLWTYEGKDPFAPPIVAGGAVYVGAGSVFYCLG